MPYCSRQSGYPASPVESYTIEDIRREYHTEKPCAPYCTVNCVQQGALMDNWRSPQKPAAPSDAPLTPPPVPATPARRKPAPEPVELETPTAVP